jgi:hypothetical protein
MPCFVVGFALRYKEMKKTFYLVVLLTFAWLQSYQLCDASEDTAEDLGNTIQAISHQHVSRASLSTPDQEFDTSIPLVVGQTLDTSRVSLRKLATRSHAINRQFQPAQTVSLVQTLQNHSPPGICLVDASLHITSLGLDHTPSHTLAPPLV